LTERLDDLGADSDLVAGTRGRGLLQALVLAAPVAGEVVAVALQRGLVVNDVAPDAVRLAPALIVDDDLDTMAARLASALAQVEREGAGVS
jgi:acetylornithine aminotransferase